ncbi:hypothetical protein E8E13_001125 [Curvularia kusanoi]|uniref:Ankyrin repeat protein n=1 Tax=Curvularia kusanoi TaxID=90978 RepID=A0A9P4TAP6_CURKU|nr:hypothetical protein E8E13_001125 [Curvularia kusanoi]
MHYAASRTNAEILYQHGADLFAKDKFGRTPLHTASKYGYPDVVQFLLSEGAAVNEPAKSGHTALLYILYCNSDEESYFLSKGAPPAENYELELAKILLDHRADINVAPPDGETVLHGAARLDDAELIRYLVEHGANLQAVDANGKTPLHNAACHANIEIVRYLINQGADTHAVTTAGQTTVHYACLAPLNLRLPSTSQGKTILEFIDEDEKWNWNAEGLVKANFTVLQ